MGFITDILNQLSALTAEHLHFVITGITASLLMIYGDDIVKVVKKSIRNFHFVFRVSIFVLLCSMGFVFLQKILIFIIRSLISQFDRATFLFPIVLIAFISIGMLAERKKQI